MNRLLIAAGAVGFCAVALGAFGAHGLEARLSPAAHDWWNTASQYALLHAIAALVLGLSERTHLARAGWSFVIGVLLFSGSLYAMALGAPHILAIATPLGGVAFLTGWALIIRHGVKRG